jgi:hypothetical protein
VWVSESSLGLALGETGGRNLVIILASKRQRGASGYTCRRSDETRALATRAVRRQGRFVDRTRDVRVARPLLRYLMVLALALSAVSLTACGPPPALPKAELDAKKLPKKHPKITATQKKNCRSCHKEAPAIRK